MKRLLMQLVLIILLVGVSAEAQIIIGPPDDQTYIDTSYVPDGVSEPPTSPPVLPTLATYTVNGVQISQLDCSRFPLICMYVDVLDQSGYPIGGMTRDSFCLKQDGNNINSFTVTQLSGDSCITSVCLVVDVSGSMSENHKLDSAKAAMHRFVDNMDPFDRAAIVPYSSCIGTITLFTSNKTTLHNAINNLVANGNTACFDGIWKGVDLTRTELGSKAVIAFTDGLENNSGGCWPPPDGVSDHPARYSDDSTIICNLANGSGIPIYTFNLGPIDNTWYNPEALQAFANGTGGFWAHAPASADMDALYDRIKQRLCSRYYICYTSLDTVQNGDWHSSIVCYKQGATCSPCDTASCQEMAAPIIMRTPATIDLSDTCQSIYNAVNICAYVTDLDSPSGDLTVTLFYRLLPGSASYSSVSMTHSPTVDSLFCFAIPNSELSCKTNVDYYITASDDHATVSDPIVNPQVLPYTINFCGNHPPVANAGADQTIAQCSPAPICWPASCSDPDGNLKLCELINGPGTYNGSQICFTPTGTLNYEFVLKATDSCGSTDYDTVVIYYTVNVAPVANAGADQTLFQCTPALVSWAAGCTDPNGNLSSCNLVSGTGSYDGTNISFTPATSGIYTFILEAADACGLKDQDTAVVNITINSAPVCHVPANASYFQCVPTEVSLPVWGTDANNNLKSCQIVSGPGSLVGGNWRFTPSGDQTVNVTVRCEDSCNAYCESSFSIQFTINDPPQISLGKDTTIFQCASQQVCLPYTVSDADNRIISEQLISGPATIDTALNNICFTPATEGNYTFIVQATDSCNATSRDTIAVTIDFNAPPTANAGTDQNIFQCSPALISWAASCSDVDGNLSNCALVSSTGTYNGTNISFTPVGSGSYTFILQATDACGATRRDTAVINVTINSAPICNMPPDTSSYFQCTPTQISLPVGATDPNGNFDHCEIVSGPGSLVGGNWVYTPSGDEFRKVVIKCLDQCGAYCLDSFFVNFDINTAPTANAGADQNIFQCTPALISWPASCADADANLTNCALISGTGTYNGTNISFTPTTSGAYTFILEATDACGAKKRDTAIITVTINSAPTANAGADQNLFQCTPTLISWPASCADFDGNLSSCALVFGTGTYNGTNISFTPTASGSYTFILEANDACGAKKRDTAIITVTINSAPTANAGADQNLFQCTPTLISWAASCSDVNGNLSSCALVAGPGTYNGSSISFTPTASGSYTFILEAADACGATKRDTAIITVAINSAPTANAGADQTLFQCSPTLISWAASCADIDGNLSSCALVSGTGSYNGTNISFTPTTSGSYTFILEATDACGAQKRDTAVIGVTINSAPIANAGIDQTSFQCLPTLVSWPASCSDINGNLSSCVLVSGIGTYNGTNISFTPTTSGAYAFILEATDACGAKGRDTAVVNVTINGKPDIAFGNDTTKFLCLPEQICMFYTISDPQGLNKLVESMVSGYGTIDTANNKICFTPTTAGDYQFIVRAVDSCGASDQDTIVAHITFGQFADIDCPTGPIGVSLCAAQTVCQSLAITPSSATVSVSYGTYSGGNLCFLADTTGTYLIRVIASTSCNADTCNLVFNVNIGQAAQLSCPGPQSKFICQAGSICTPIGVVGSGAVVTVSPIGSYSVGNVCFPADTSGHYVLTVIASTVCGADTCQLVTDVIINSSPVAINPPTPIDTFMCASAQVCRQFSASDINGGTLTWTKISGSGAVSSTGQWCFTPSSAGAYSIVAKVADSCGAADTVSMTYNIDMNDAPSIAFGNDSTAFLCSSTPVCFGYTVSDPDNNITKEEIISGSGTIDTVQNKICFTPTAAGEYTFIARVTDGCGLTDVDTIKIAININHVSTASAGSDQTLFQCSPTLVSWPASCSDIDGNLSSCALVSSTGTYNGTNISFIPTASGSYTFILEATDACGAKGRDTAIIGITLNSAPVANAGSNQTIFQCSPTQVSWAASCSDIDGNLSSCALVEGPGTYNGTNINFTPTASGAYTFILEATDACGLKNRDTAVINVTINSAPIVDAGADQNLFQCNAGAICWPASCTDVNNNLASCVLVAGPGSYNGTNICFTPSAPGSYTFILEATDVCGAKDRDTVVINVATNNPPVANAGADQSLFLCASTLISWPTSCADIDGNLTNCALVSGTGSYNGTNISFTPTANGTYTFILEATDGCGVKDRDTAIVNVTLNVAPTCNVPRDTTIFQCNPAQVCLPVSGTDANSNLKFCQITNGPGTLNNGQWCYTPSGDQAASVTIRCEDSCGVFCESTFNVQFNVNERPNIAFGNDTTIFQCNSQAICLTYTLTDPENNVTLEELVSGSGTIDAVNNRVCFTPSLAGLYTFIVRATDACGLTDLDTINVTINANHAPTAQAGADQTLFQCTPTAISWPASCADIDGNLSSCALVASPGAYNGTNISFTPTVSGNYQFILEATDACGLKARDTAVINVVINSAPVCQMPPRNNSFFQCTPTQVSLPVGATDVNNNFDHCEITYGPGSIVAGNWVYTPSGDESKKVIIKCLDQCGAFCIDSFFVQFNINDAPVIDAGKDTTYFACGNLSFCRTVSASDANSNLKSVELISTIGTYNPVTRQICANINYADVPSTAYSFIMKATDSCNLVDYDTVVITVDFNNPPTIEAPPDFSIFLDMAGPFCFDAEIFDIDGNLGGVEISPIGTYNPITKQICINADTTGHYCLVISAHDVCGALSSDTVCIDVQLDECIHVQIEKVENALQGYHQSVQIMLNGSGKQLGGFDFLIAYDQSVLTPTLAIAGSLLDTSGCGWEYFTFRFGAEGNCTNGCPSGLLRVVAMAETNNGAYHPECYLNGMVGTLAIVDFLVSNNRAYECQYAPIRFFWIDCGDNAISSKLGDTLWIARDVYDFEHNLITDFTASLPTYLGAPDAECLTSGGPGKPMPIRCIDFTDGGIDIVCADSIDLRGDINLNGVPNEIGDAVVFTNYFTAGLAAFTVNPQGQIAATEVNGDGIALSVADLVYLIRVIIGDVNPLAKPMPGALASFSSNGETVSLDSDVPVGAAFFIFEGHAYPTLAEGAAGMEIKYSYAEGTTRVLVYSMERSHVINNGNILNINGKATLISVDASDYNGAVLAVNKDFLKPVKFTLQQNYPNPFNPMTMIEYSLPEAGEWNLEIFNVLGQKVKSWAGQSEAGSYRIEWDANGLASGIYLYRLTTGKYTATKKMILLK
jgi:VWFA-related protein